MSQPTPPVDYQHLLVLLTSERLGSYFSAAEGDIDAAFALYEWNIEVAAAALSLTAMVEVVLRNAIDREMRTWAAARGATDWLTAAPLDAQGRSDITKARTRAARGRQTVTHGHVVAELNLGFWRFLMSRKYFTSLWIPALQHAFPHATGDARLKRGILEGHTQQLLYLRNRAAHHEPLHQRDLRADLDRSLQLAQAIHPTAGAWVANHQQLGQVLERRPLL